MSCKQKTIIAAGLGELLFDVVHGQYHLGGAPGNFAWHCAELGAKASVVGAVGRDRLGDEACKLLGSLASAVIRSNYPTGTVNAKIGKDGSASYTFDDECAFDHLQLNDDLLALAERCDLLCFGTLAQRLPESRQSIHTFLSKACKALKIFDVNLRGNFFTKDVIEQSLMIADLLKVSWDELKLIAELLNLRQEPDAFFKDLRARFPLRGLAVTSGEQGSLVFWQEECSAMPAPDVTVQDTIGAGDSFDAALGMGLVCDLGLVRSHFLATQVSAYVCSVCGAMPKLPNDLKQYIRRELEH